MLTFGNLSGAKEVWFMIEIWGLSGGVLSPIACDYGRASPKRITAEAGADGGCKPFVDRGFRYLVDTTRPKLDPAVQIPAQQPSLTVTSAPGQFASRAVASENAGPIQFSVTDSSTGGSGFNTKLNRSSVSIRIGNTYRYCVKSNIWPQGHPCRDRDILEFKETVSDNGYRLIYRWQDIPVANLIPDDTPTTFTIEARDYANNTIGTSITVHRTSVIFISDTIRPSIANGWVRAAPEPRFFNTTGIGAIAKVNVSMDEPHLNRSIQNTSAIRAFFWARTFSGAACTLSDTSRCLFASAVFPLQFVRTIPNLTAGAAHNYWVGYPQVANATGTTPVLPPGKAGFDVSMTVIAVDAAKRQSTRDFLNVFRIEVGAPVITPNATITGYVRTGPYNLSANIADANPGLNESLVKLRISNLTGEFASTPTGWTKLGKSNFEKKFDSKEGSLFKWAIPNAPNGMVLAYQFRASDGLGNLATTADVNSTAYKFTVDKTGPALNESNQRNYRGPSSLVVNYTSLDTGVGVDTKNASLHFRVKGTTAWTNVNMTFNNNIFSGKINGTFKHKDVIEYYADAKDKLGNLASNGSATAPKNFTIDLQKPVTTLDPIAATSSDGRITLAAVATDPDSGIASITFEGRYKNTTGLFTNWETLANGTNPALGPMCLAGTITYEFRAFSIDKAANVGDRSQVRSTTVTNPGCLAELVVRVQQPAALSAVDAQGGTGHKEVQYTASSTGTFTTSGFIHVNIDFSPDDGKHWFPIARDQPNTGKYDWLVSAPGCDKCLIRVVANAPGGQRGEGASGNFVIINGNPTTDLDGNGVYDDCELRSYLVLGVATATGDDDGDGLKNQQECALGTDPTNGDTDGDGASDGAEHKLHHNPLSASDKPSGTDLRYEQWGNYYLIIPLLFIAVAAVFLLGIARRW